jgi:uncharacterized protein YrrD
MLYRLQGLLGSPITAPDGEIGRIEDVYFDDCRWVARYLVVDTGGWLSGRKVLISAISVGSIDWGRNLVHVGLNRQQVKASPAIDTDKLASRQLEGDFLDYYGHPYYWSGPSLWGMASHPVSPVGLISQATNAPGTHGETPTAAHLRSVRHVTGHDLQATDDPIGCVEDFLLDDTGWAIRYLVVDARNWLPGRHVVIPPQWIKGVDWVERVVNVDVARDNVQAAPEYHSAQDFSRRHETDFYRHYQRPGYWQ